MLRKLGNSLETHIAGMEMFRLLSDHQWHTTTEFLPNNRDIIPPHRAARWGTNCGTDSGSGKVAMGYRHFVGSALRRWVKRGIVDKRGSDEWKLIDDPTKYFDMTP